MKRLLAFASAVLLLPLVFTACDKKEELAGNTSPVPPPPPPAAAPATPKAEPSTTLTPVAPPVPTPPAEPVAPAPAPAPASPVATPPAPTPAVPAPPAEQPPANAAVLDPRFVGFKAEIESVRQFMEEKQKAASPDPLAMVVATLGKLKAVKTAGLPEDFVSAWKEFTGVFDEIGNEVSVVSAAGRRSQAEGEKAFAEFMPKMVLLDKKMEPIATKLEEVGKKYGLEHLGKLATGGQ